MSIVDADDRVPVEMYELVADPPGCFYCGVPVVLPIILWSGAHNSIFMHPACAETLHFSLARDLWEWRRNASHADFGLVGVTTPRVP